MTLDEAIGHYVELRKQVDAIRAKAKKDAAELTEKMAKLETWLALKADEQGLNNINTEHGTGYWSTLHNCSVASPEAFFTFVQENNAYDLMEKRASKTAVREHVEEHGTPPPGINFSSYKKFNVRERN